LDIVYGEVTQVLPVLIFKKMKPRKSPKERLDSDICLDYDLPRLADQSGALFSQNCSGWNQEYLMAHYCIPHLRKHTPKQTSALLDYFSGHHTEQVLETFGKIQNKVLASPTKLHSYHPAFVYRSSCSVQGTDQRKIA